MEIRFVPDAPAAWLLYDLASVVLALPTEQRAVADAIAALPPTGVDGVLAALEASGVAAAAPFAALEATPGGLRVALRGPATVATAAETLTGLGAAPHLDRRISGVAVARLSIPGGEWMLTFGSAAPPPAPALRRNQEVTAIPDVEISAPALPAPPSLGLGLDLGAPPVPSAVPALHLPDGSREPLDVALVIGRAPALPAGGPASRAVRMRGDGDISRTHARVAVEGGTVLVTDLGSRNGTIVRIPGRAPLKLRRHEPTPVLVGTVIDFGGGAEVTVRED